MNHCTQSAHAAIMSDAAVIVTVLAVVTKVIGCGLASMKMGRRKALQIGVGMIPRGEVGIIVAQLGLSMAAVSDAIYGVVLAMAVATTIIAPLLIKPFFRGEEPPPVTEADVSELQHEIA